MAELNFDATQVAPQQSLDAIPAGWYSVMAVDSTIKPTKDGTGAFLEMVFDVIDGQFKGRKLFSRFNLHNANPIAVEIARKQLSALCHATGVLQAADSVQLHNIPLKVKVKVRKATEDFEASNEISAYENVNYATAPATPVAAAVPLAVPAWTPPQGQQPWQQPTPTVAPAQTPAPAAQPAWATQPPIQQPAAAPAPAATVAAPAQTASNVPPWMQQPPQ